MMLGKLDKLEATVTLARIDIAQLKVKSGVWGFIAGAIPALVIAVWAIVK